MAYKACIFDFDLTLADSSKGILICFKYVLERFGYPPKDDKTIYDTIGMTLVDAFDLLTDTPNNPQREDMRVAYVKKADEVMVKNTFFYSGVIAAMKDLRAQGVKIGICSTKYRYRIADTFAAQAGETPADLIIGGEDVPSGMAKPDPCGLLKCIEGLGAEKSETLYVGDSYIDAETAQRAGVDFAGVLTGSTTAEDFAKYPSVLIAQGAADVMAYASKNKQ